MYNISDFLHFPAKNKMYEGAARVQFIFTGKCKMSTLFVLIALCLYNLKSYFISLVLPFPFLSNIETQVNTV